METIKTIEGYLPVFPGFYESIYENGDTGYYAIHEAIDDCLDMYDTEMTDDDFDFDYESRRDDIIKKMCEVTEDYLGNLEFVTEVTPMGLVSPKYYNYDSDHEVVRIGFDETWSESMKTYIDEYREELTKMIEDNHTSYDGFMSFMSNRLATWETIIFHYKEIDEIEEKYSDTYSDEYIDALEKAFPNVSAWDIRDNYRRGEADKYIMYMLFYILDIYYRSNGGYERDITTAIAIDVLEDIYDGSYVRLSESGKEKMEGKECYYAKTDNGND